MNAYKELSTELAKDTKFNFSGGRNIEVHFDILSRLGH
jgi:hypothetical protein